MDDSRSKRSLADDPNFLARLADLDRGLSDNADADVIDPAPRLGPPRPARSAQPPPAAPPPTASPRPAPPPTRAAAAPHPAPAASFPASMPPPPGGARARRALIDLFPPAPKELERPPDPLLGLSPGPQLPASRRLHVDAPTKEVRAYETFYGLDEEPFNLAPDLRFLYHSASHDRAVEDLLAAIRRREGIVIVTGERGIGKTTLCRAAIDQLDRRTLTSFLGDPYVSIEEWLKTVLVDFGVIARDDLARGRLTQATREELTDTLRSFVSSLGALQASAVLLVDDAQNLTPEVLEQLRVLDSDRSPHVLQLVLVGEPNLIATLDRPELKQLAQRVTLRCNLGPLQRDEIPGYVVHRLAIAGSRARVEFTDGALGRVFELSRGVPRAVNLICDRALTLGHEVSASVIDDELIEGAADHNLDIGPPAAERRSVLQVMVTVVAIVSLMLLGASAAALLFRDRVARAVILWQAIPDPPGDPIPRLPVPLSPIPPPAE